MELIDYEALYDKKFKEIYDKGIAQLKRYFENNKGFSLQAKLESIGYAINQEQNSLRYKVNSKDSFNIDPFIEALLPEFARRNYLYNSTPISLFLENQLPALKSKFAGKEDSLTVPAVYHYNNIKLIDFLAHFSALESLKKYIGEIEENEHKPAEKNILSESSETTARQVLLMHYIFEGLRVSGRTQNAKIRIIRALTGKNENKIKEILKDPLGYKEISGQIKDLEYVRKFFEDLDQEGIINNINKDYLSLTSKVKNDKNK